MVEECIFCKIIRGELPGKFLAVSEYWISLTPIDQVSKGHTLLIPKNHFQDIFDLGENELKELGAVVQKLSKKLISENDAKAINLLNASGMEAQQSVFHFHLHLVPRYSNDGLDLWIKQKL